jgi:competence protein ComEC
MKHIRMFSILLVIGIVLLGREITLQENGTMRWEVPYIGQGDAMLITTPSGKQIVIDGGPNQDLLTVLGEKMPWFDRTIELVILSHPDSDHITALPEVLRRYNIQTIIMTGLQHTSGRYASFVDAITQNNIRLITPEFGKRIDMGDGVVLETIWPLAKKVGQKTNSANHESVVVRVLYGTQSILLTGDIEAEAEHAILASGQDIHADFLQVAHHGSRSSTVQEFLNAVNPKMAIISVGKDNQFNHPHTEVVQRLLAKNIPIWNTAEDGNFSLELTNKNAYSIKK